MQQPSGKVLTLLYDGACPICRMNFEYLRKRYLKAQRAGSLQFQDITEPGFEADKYGLTRIQVQSYICGILEDGRVVRGMEALRIAYKLAGKGWLLAPTGWIFLRPLFDLLYIFVSKNRIRISRLLGLKSTTTECRSCSDWHTTKSSPE